MAKPKKRKLTLGARPGLVPRIRLAMIKKGYSRRALARASGSANSSVACWLEGKHIPNDDRLRALAEALGVSVDWLLTGRVEKQG